MPLDRLFRREAEEAASFTDFVASEIHAEITRLVEELRIFETAEWAMVENLLAEESRRAFADMMSGDAEQMVLARERARVVSRITGKPEELRARLADLQRQLAEIEGEAE